MTTDDDLLLYYYDDGLDEMRRGEIAAALATDRALAERYETLAAELDGLRSAPDREAPADAVIRWRYALDRAAAATSTPRWQRPALALAAAAAVLAVGVAIGIRVGTGPGGTGPAPMANDSSPSGEPAIPVVVSEPPPMAPTRPVAVMRPAAATRGLADYLQSSRARLARFDTAPDDERTALIADILAQNRAFERQAAASGAPDLARVLRALEQSLIELADDGAVAADGQERLEFELSAMLTRLTLEPSYQPSPL